MKNTMAVAWIFIISIWVIIFTYGDGACIKEAKADRYGYDYYNYGSPLGYTQNTLDPVIQYSQTQQVIRNQRAIQGEYVRQGLREAGRCDGCVNESDVRRLER